MKMLPDKLHKNVRKSTIFLSLFGKSQTKPDKKKLKQVWTRKIRKV